MRAIDVMQSDIAFLTDRATVDLAESLAAVLEVRHIPVVSVSQKLIGILSIRDILAHYVESCGDESARIRDLMSKDLVSCSPETTLAEVATLMSENNVSCIPVVDPNNELLGVVTERDFVRHFHTIQKSGTGGCSNA